MKIKLYRPFDWNVEGGMYISIKNFYIGYQLGKDNFCWLPEKAISTYGKTTTKQISFLIFYISFDYKTINL